MRSSDELPLMRNLPRAELPTDEPLILASGSPRRGQLLRAAGYSFTVQVARDSAECGICSRETAPEMVARYAYQKANDVSSRNESGMILAADTVASCLGQILGKPRDHEHAERILRTLSGRRHDVYTGVCLLSILQHKCVVEVVRTELEMQPIDNGMLAEYLDSMMWEGKAGAFGYQDGNDWLRVVGGEREQCGRPTDAAIGRAVAAIRRTRPRSAVISSSTHPWAARSARISGISRLYGRQR